MDRLEAMRVFVAVADASGFAPAARSLGLSAPFVTRAVAALEADLGVRLLHRTTRVTRLTDAGLRYLPECERVLAALAAAEASVLGSLAEPTGELRVTAPVRFGTMFVAPIVFSYLERHSRVAARLVLVDRPVALVEEGFDVAVRIGHLADSSLVARRVGRVRQLVCAAPSYLSLHGRPRTLRAVERHVTIALPPDMALHRWVFRVPQRRPVTLEPESRLMVSSVEAAVAAAVAGQGLVRVLSYQVAAEVAAGRLEVVLKKQEPPPIPVHVVSVRGRDASLKVRAFVDQAVEKLREGTWSVV